MADQQPPPGSPPPGSPPPSPYPAPGTGPSSPYSQPYPQPSPARPLHRPGSVPLRPLTLSDFFDAAFRTIRANPKATIGMGALVTGACLLLPIVLTLLLGLSGNLGSLVETDTPDSFGVGTGELSYGIGSLVTSLLSALAGVLVSGLVVPVVTRSAIGRRLSIGESWQQSKGRLLALIGLGLLEVAIAVVLIGLAVGVGVALAVGTGQVGLGIGIGVLVGLAALLLSLFVHVRWFLLGAPALVAERRGVRAALARGARLSRGAFWRLLGTWLLVRLVAGFVGGIVGFAVGLVGGILGSVLPDSIGTAAVLLSTQLSSVFSGAVVTPFVGTVAVLQYLDMRFRKEGFDLELIQHTGGSPDQPR